MLLMRMRKFGIGGLVVLSAAIALFYASSLSKVRIESSQAHQSAPPRLSAGTITQLFPRSTEHDFEPPEPGSYALPVIGTASDGDVLDTEGKAQKLKRYMRGKISVLSFIYAMCSEEKGCPLATATLFDTRDASAHLPRISRNTRFISLSFDPVRDTPAAMQSYGYPALADPEADKKIPWTFLTTASARQLKPILRGYGQSINPRADGQTISHLLRLYLVDRRGRIRNIYGLGFLDPRLLFTDIETLLLEETNSGAGAGESSGKS